MSPSIRKVLPAPVGWPEPPAPDAYHGLAGEIVQAIAPHTEADPVSVLVQLLVACGALIGRGAWFAVEATRHHPAEFAVLVGESSRARKGTSYDHIERLLGELRLRHEQPTIRRPGVLAATVTQRPHQTLASRQAVLHP